MGGRDGPALNKDQLREGHRKSLHNAGRLIDDAKLLGEHGHYRAGYLLLLLATEELGKAIWLRIGQTIEANKWRRWWSSFVSHPDKQAASILAWAQANEPADYEKNWRDIHKRIDKAAKRVALLRQKTMYVDFKDGAFLSPLGDKELQKDFAEELGFAEWLLKWLT